MFITNMSKEWTNSIGIDAFGTLPDAPGVYFFMGVDRKILYIGKATSLRDRVRSYFSQDILETRGPKIAKMLVLVRSVAWRGTDSVLEALILESKLIREHQPLYNTDAKDDKSYAYVVITEERFPRVLIVRGRDIAEGKFIEPTRAMYGPFPHGSQLREAMKLVRRIFPFRDSCIPSEKRKAKSEKDRPRACFHRQIGLCPGVCTGEITVREYGRIIRNIELFFEGKKGMIVRKMTREMSVVAKKLEFERASEIKRTLFALQHVQDVALLADSRQPTLDSEASVRIESYDVAHLAGKSTVGVMTVIGNAGPEKSAYRKFILHEKHRGNDLTALEEVLRRRMRHSEWPKPDVVVVDGSFLQFSVAEKVFVENEWADVKLVGVVKNAQHRPERLIGDDVMIAKFRRQILLVNAEAHRFAIGFHRDRRGKEFLKR